jgi:hypothetical protein
VRRQPRKPGTAVRYGVACVCRRNRAQIRIDRPQLLVGHVVVGGPWHHLKHGRIRPQGANRVGRFLLAVDVLAPAQHFEEFRLRQSFGQTMGVPRQVARYERTEALAAGEIVRYVEIRDQRLLPRRLARLQALEGIAGRRAPSGRSGLSGAAGRVRSRARTVEHGVSEPFPSCFGETCYITATSAAPSFSAPA